MDNSEKIDKLIYEVADMKAMLNGHLHMHEEKAQEQEKRFSRTLPILVGTMQLAATIAVKLLFH